MNDLAAALRAAGCVFADDEAALLRAAARDDAELAALRDRRIAGEPIEHIVGVVEFCGLTLRVGPGVFVPRQRTRLLAELARDRVLATSCATASAPTFLEIFGGVGPVAAVVRAAVPSATVFVADVDGDALEYASLNVGPESRIQVESIFNCLPETLRGTLDVIAGVPPYVPTSAAPQLPREARDFEPHRALFGGADGLDLARQTIREAPGWLARGGHLLLELHRDQAAAAGRITEARGFRAQVHRADDGQTVVLDAVLPLERHAPPPHPQHIAPLPDE